MRYNDTMDIRIKATNFTLNESVTSYLDERLATITRHLGAEAENARLEVEVGRDAGHSQRGENFFAELQLRIPGGNYARVVGAAETVQAAIDEAKDEMLRKLRTSKREHAGFLRKSGAALKRMLRME
jgi:ribosome-associated translation inhibitor RaiA